MAPVPWGTVLACGCRGRMERMFAVTCARFSRYLMLVCWCPFWDDGVDSGMLMSILG